MANDKLSPTERHIKHWLKTNGIMALCKICIMMIIIMTIIIIIIIIIHCRKTGKSIRTR